MKSVQEALLERRSIRRYEYEQVTDEQMEFIYDAIRNTPTSYNGQQYCVIEVSDQETKLKLYELTNQKQIKTCSRFLAFCIDYHKLELGARAKGIEFPAFTQTMDGLMVGMIDAATTMMSAVVAATAQGLGTCCIGYARTAAPREISEILGLPDKVFLVCGMAIGVPREMPDLKPKQPQALTIHRNRYSDEGMAQAMLDYDALIQEYNATRSGTKTTNDFVDHILGYYREALKYRMLDALRAQGFDPKV